MSDDRSDTPEREAPESPDPEPVPRPSSGGDPDSLVPGEPGRVPRLPRGKGLSLRTSDLVRIGMFATFLIMVIALGKPCANGAASFVESFSPPPDAGPHIQYQRLTEEEIRKRFGGEPDAGAAAPAPDHPGAKDTTRRP